MKRLGAKILGIWRLPDESAPRVATDAITLHHSLCASHLQKDFTREGLHDEEAHRHISIGDAK
jgi:hypothetical protein